MKIHEYQAKQLLGRMGVAVPEGRACTSAAEVERAYAELASPLCVVKAQIHAGGRGKAGGVKLVRSAAEARAAAEGMLGRALVTHQTGPDGQLVRRLWIEQGSAIEREFYVGIAIDRERKLPVMMASSEGGMEIEEVAAHSPEKILRAPFDPAQGLARAEAERLARGIGVPQAVVARAADFMVTLAQAFGKLDCSIAEINPLVTTKDGRVLALDAKINFDDNALFRHEELAALRDLDEEDPKEIEASKYGLSYIALDGNIGCMVNGAGLAMATMDVIKLAGSEPANFLDVGGGATKETVAAGFRILLKDPNVKGIFINIFGGIVRCERIANGVIEAAKEVKITVPLVVRLQGTNAEEGRKLLADSGLKLDVANDLWEAAQKIVKLTGKAA